jgi:subtilisin family serine protease
MNKPGSILLRWLFVALIAFSVVCLPSIGAAQTAAQPTPAYVPGEVIVTYREGVDADRIVLLEARYKVTVKRAFPEIRAKLYLLPENSDVQSAIDMLVQEPIVETAEPNAYRRIKAVPTDPRFGEQWSLLNTGQTVNGFVGPSGIDIRWTQAIDAFTGTSPVVVAVVDTGVAIDHPEIAASLWNNPAETSNGIDDDGNGYVDDVIGWDFVGNSRYPADVHGHGTLIASLIAAPRGNGQGGAGIAPTARIMPLRVANSIGQCSQAASMEAFLYAARNGAKIINFSAGYSGAASFSAAEMATLRYLDSKGILVVTAAGNGGDDGFGDNNDVDPSFPAAYSLVNVLTVGAIDRSGGLAGFSNYGPQSVDIAAPGTDIFGADVRRVLGYLENFEYGAPGWTSGPLPGSATSLPWSIVPSGLNHYLTDSADSYGNQIPYTAYTHTGVLSPPISLGVGSQAAFELGVNLAAGDCGFMEVTRDAGQTWNLATFPLCGPLYGMTVPAVDLTAYDLETIQVRFRLVTDGSYNADGIGIDNFLISNVELFNYDGTQYRYQNGTSFSAPLVSGVAALLMSQRPELSHRKIKQLILDAASKSAALSGKVLTGGMLDANGALLSAKSATPPLPQTNLFSAVLPASRSVPVGGTATAFATIINAGATMAEGCTLAPASGLPGHFTFQTTNPATNAVTGTPNTPVNVPAGGIQSFVIAFRPYAAFNPADFQLEFSCYNAPAAGVTVGLNTLLLSASATPVPDVVALAATISGDGIANIPGVSGTGVFAVASVNVGASGTIVASADTGSAVLPVRLALCETNPATGACLQPPGASVLTTIAANATPTFGIFLNGTGSAVPFDPAGHRVFVRFRDGGGAVRGATSVALRTQ